MRNKQIQKVSVDQNDLFHQLLNRITINTTQQSNDYFSTNSQITNQDPQQVSNKISLQQNLNSQHQHQNSYFSNQQISKNSSSFQNKENYQTQIIKIPSKGIANKNASTPIIKNNLTNAFLIDKKELKDLKQKIIDQEQEMQALQEQLFKQIQYCEELENQNLKLKRIKEKNLESNQFKSKSGFLKQLSEISMNNDYGQTKMIEVKQNKSKNSNGSNRQNLEMILKQPLLKNITNKLRSLSGATQNIAFKKS